jgi:hypothetical protein
MGGEGRGGRGPFGRGGFDPSAMVGQFDPDGDGTIRVDELDERLRMRATFMLQSVGLDVQQPIQLDEVRRRMEQRRGERGGGDTQATGANRDATKQAEQNKEAARDAYRVTGSERLKGRRSYGRPAREAPKDVPGWWDRRDENKDGQVTMAEFSSDSSQSKDEYSEFDVNGDGVITLKEAQASKADEEEK